MRDLLSPNSVKFEDRNIAKEPKWRKDLLALTGEIVVPVLVVAGQHSSASMKSAWQLPWV